MLHMFVALVFPDGHLLARPTDDDVAQVGRMVGVDGSAEDARPSANRDNWNDRTAVHFVSRFYDIDGWLRAGPGPERPPR